MKEKMSYPEFKKAVLNELKYGIYPTLSEEQQKLWEDKVDSLDEKDIEDVCKEHYDSENRNVESCAWCLHMFA